MACFVMTDKCKISLVLICFFLNSVVLLYIIVCVTVNLNIVLQSIVVLCKR